ncbi:hypothetical protein CBS101457_006128 [Exobasidium rhododendri]|nr:hypothetical protein CBS101457_006128 [Exobasidium rhododendri]
MKLSFLAILLPLASLATPALTQPTGGSSATDVLAQRPLKPLLRNNANHIVQIMLTATNELSAALNKAIEGNSVTASMEPAVNGLNNLNFALQDSKVGLLDGRLKINDIEELYGTLVKLDVAIQPVTVAVAGLKVGDKHIRLTALVVLSIDAPLPFSSVPQTTFDKLDFTGMIAYVLESLEVAFADFAKALETRVHAFDVNKCVAGPIMSAVCHLDETIDTLKGVAGDTHRCSVQQLQSRCPSSYDIPRKPDGLNKCHGDTRRLMAAAYRYKCFGGDCTEDQSFCQLDPKFVPESYSSQGLPSRAGKA